MATGFPDASDARDRPAELLALRRSAGALIISETDPANQHVAEHDPVADQAVQWVFKGGGPVFLKLEMADPGKAVADYRQGQQPQQLAGDQCPGSNEQNEKTARKVQTATGYIAVFFKIERIEFREIVEGLLVAHCVATHRCTTASFIVVGRPDYD